MKKYNRFIFRITYLLIITALFLGSFNLAYAEETITTSAVKKLSMKEIKELAVKNNYQKNINDVNRNRLSRQEDNIISNLNNATYAQRQASGTAGFLKRQLEDINADLAPLEELDLDGDSPDVVAQRTLRDALRTQKTNYQAQINSLDSIITGSSSNSAFDSLEAIRVNKDGIEDSYELLDRLVEYEVELNYITYFILDTQTSSLENDFSKMKKLLETEQVKRTIGMSSQESLLSMEYNTYKVENALEQLKISKEAPLTSLKKAMGMPLYQKIELEELNIEDFRLMNYDVDLQFALDNSIEINNAQKDVDRKKNYLSNLNERYPNGSKTAPPADLDVKEAQLKLEEAKRKTEARFKKAYQDLSGKRQKLNMAIEDLNNAKRNYDYQKIRYNLGMLSKLQFETAQRDYEGKLLDRKQTQYDYMLSLASYEAAKKGIGM